MGLTAYPLRTEPFLRDYLWGGRKLHSRLGKALPSPGAWAESWEIIDHPEHQSIVTNGAWAGESLGKIAADDPQWLFGGQAAPGQRLPLLLKYLDCHQVLSIQVHPDDAYAGNMSPPDLGKTEAWYIIEAEPTGVLYAGLRNGVSKQQLRAAIAAGSVDACLHQIQPKAGDCIFIPAGTVHALGAGLLVAEIQQASNTTFRLFDWNRVDAHGQSRPLHVEQALEVIDFDSGPRERQIPADTEQPGRQRLVSCDKFVFDRLSGQATMTVAGDGRFHFLTAPSGGVELSGPDGVREQLAVGESVLVPAAMRDLEANLTGEAVLLDMFVP